jgi:hypothetical protein
MTRNLVNPSVGRGGRRVKPVPHVKQEQSSRAAVDEDGAPAYSARAMITYLAPRDHAVTLDGLALHYCEWGAAVRAFLA